MVFMHDLAVVVSLIHNMHTGCPNTSLFIQTDAENGVVLECLYKLAYLGT